jgi:hypothetical protein
LPPLPEPPKPVSPPRIGAEHDQADAAAQVASKRKKRVLWGASFI